MKSVKRYKAILIDPPWKFKVWSEATGLDRSAEKHYPTMDLATLKLLPVQTVMDDDCAVFMWITWPMMPDALELAEAWGLEYKTCAFLWAKLNKRAEGRFAIIGDLVNWFMGMGYWTRSNSEACLLFTKGKPKRKAADVRQLVVSPVRRHSQKPDSIYGFIERLVDGPYCEFFARKTQPGWDCWGNEVKSTVKLGEM